jgi:uncharacterized protein
VDKYLFFGGYPGAAPLVRKRAHWARHVADSLIETSIARDVLLLSRVDKSALLRRTFALACRYSGQVPSYSKMLGQLPDAANATTLAHYLDLLAGAGLVTGLQNLPETLPGRRGSNPMLQLMNTALLTAPSGLTLAEARRDGEFRGRLLESAVGAHLANAAANGECTAHRSVEAVSGLRGKAPPRMGGGHEVETRPGLWVRTQAVADASGRCGMNRRISTPSK